MAIDLETELRDQFLAFSSYGIRNETVNEMDGAHFAKYAQDCQLYDRAVRPSDVDLMFCKVKAKGSRRIDFDRFLHALNLIAQKKGVSFIDVVKHCLRSEGPTTTGTRARSVRLHDDKMTYTGVYARGGPTNVDIDHDLSTITNRSAADVRGVKLPPRHANGGLQRRRATMDSMGLHDAADGDPVRSLHGAPLSSPGESRRASLGPSEHYLDSRPRARADACDDNVPRRAPMFEGLDPLRNTFLSFACFGKRTSEDVDVNAVKLDGASFAKLCKESGLLDARLNTTRVDLIFTKCCDHKSKRMSYQRFVTVALAELAAAKAQEPHRVSRAIATCQGPLLRGTIAASVRLHDDKNLHTGAWRQGGPSIIDRKHDLNLEELVNRDADEQRHARRLSAVQAFR